MIRLRHSLERGLRHPMLGPLLLLFLVLVLAFMFLHTLEHGVEGLLFSCAVVAAAALWLLVLPAHIWRSAEQLTSFGRSPPARAGRPVLPSRLPPLRVALPLRL